MMAWISFALEARAADDAKASGEKKEAKSEPSKGGTAKLEGKEAPGVMQAAIGMKSIDPNTDGPVGDFDLGNFRGRNVVVLAFFRDPKETDSVDELKQLSGQMSQFKQNGVIIVGISNSPLYREKRLLNREKVSFPLLGDENNQVCKSYGVVENGKVNRTTFIIDKNGKVRKVIDTKDPKKHGQEVLDAVKNLK
jgi:peroxiredoxin Q/BCP